MVSNDKTYESKGITMNPLFTTSVPAAVPAAKAEIDLVGRWNSFWTGMYGGAPEFWNFVTFIGILFVAYAAWVFIWERRRGSGGSIKKVVGFALVGLFLISPDICISILLQIGDWIVAMAMSIWNAAT